MSIPPPASDGGKDPGARCIHEVAPEFCGNCQTPRWKDYLSALWCLAFDWTDAVSRLYRGDKRGPLVWLGAQAQTVWFRAHNNRFYNWLDEPHDTRCEVPYPPSTNGGRIVRCNRTKGHRGRHSGDQYLDWDDPLIAVSTNAYTFSTTGQWTSSLDGNDTPPSPPTSGEGK